MAWFENGQYVGSTPPGAFKESEVITQELIRKRIGEVGFQDPMFKPEQSRQSAREFLAKQQKSFVYPDFLDKMSCDWLKIDPTYRQK